MNGNRNQRALLMETLIAVLFFALCACVLLRTFAAAREYSLRAGVESAALLRAEDLAERLSAAPDAGALLAADGFAEEEGVWRMNEADWRVEVTVAREATEAGSLTNARVSVLQGDAELASLPAARYTPGEAAE